MISPKAARYFPFDIQISREFWDTLRLGNLIGGEQAGRRIPLPIIFYRTLATRLSRLPGREGRGVQPGLLNLYSLMIRIYRYLLDKHLDELHPGELDRAVQGAGFGYGDGDLPTAGFRFAELFPGIEVLEQRETPTEFLHNDRGHLRLKRVLKESLLLRLAAENKALDSFREILDDSELAAASPYRPVAAGVDRELDKGPHFDPLGLPIMELLRAPIKSSPDSLSGQLEYIRSRWSSILPEDILSEMLTAFDILAEEEREWWGTPGPPVVPEFDRFRGLTSADYEYPEYERFSPDADWMSNVVLIAKMVYVWLDQLTKKYGRPINRLDEIPDEELDQLQRWGFTALWLIGIWERSPSSQKIKHLAGNHDAVASAYSLYDYVIASDLGGEGALDHLRDRCLRRGIRLSSDMVPNHTGIYSKWIQEHPDWFVQSDYLPYPGYSFTGPDLSFASHLCIQIEDGYWNHSDAAVVFRHEDRHSGRVRYIYHGNDGTSTPWNDTAQLNYLIPEVREAVIQTILHVARKFPIIRFDAAMTLAKKHYQRLWFPQPGHGGGVPSRAERAMTREEFDRAFPQEFWREVVDRVAQEVPDTLLLAEAFWLMEGYFVRTLGMHRVYNSAFMNMLKMEENAKYRQTVKNVLEFNPEILKRFVNFMNNPDERTAIEQFGKEGKYLGAAVLLVTMPGLPMIGHGQIEGFFEKYGMEYRRAYWSEEPDQHLIRVHEEKIFPLMRRRYLFSGSSHFVFYDFWAEGGVNENVFAYSNRFGHERGLVLYHNVWGNTAGWIKTSTAFAVKVGDGSELRQTTLGEALGFNADGRCYYAFRDYSCGLEYLRHGRELVEKGMFVELGGYQYHAFLDFREIVDDDYGTWGQLCRMLDNRPVRSLEEEVKQVRYREFLEPCSSLFDRLQPRLDLLFDPSAPAIKRKEALLLFQQGLVDFLTLFKSAIQGKGDPKAIAAAAMQELEGVGRLTALKGQNDSGKAAIAFLCDLLDGDFNRLTLLGFAVMEAAGRLVPSAAAPAKTLPLKGAFFRNYGFNRILEDGLRSVVEQGSLPAFPWGEERDLQLISILLRHQGFFTAWSEKLRKERIAALLADPEAREFLLIHTSGGVEWFSKERYEGLLHWLFLAAALTLVREEAEDDRLLLEITLLFETTTGLFDLAERAGYRVDDFESLAAGEEA